MKKSKLSIRSYILLICALNVSVTLVLFTIGFYQQRELVISQNKSNADQLISQLSQSAAVNCNLYENMLINIGYSEIVQSFLENDDILHRIEIDPLLDDFVSNFVTSSDAIQDIAVISTKGMKFNLSGKIDDVEEIVKEIPPKQLIFYSGMKKYLPYPGAGYRKAYFIIGVQVYSITHFDNKQPIGTILLCVDAKHLLGLTKNGAETPSGLLFFDRNRNLFYSDQSYADYQIESLLFDSAGELKVEHLMLDNKRYYIHGGDIGGIDGKIVTMISQEQLLGGFEKIRTRQLAAVSLIMLVLIPVSIFLARAITVPLKTFMRFLNDAENQDVNILKRQIELGGPVEIQVLLASYNHMMKQVNTLTHRLLESATNLYESEVARRQAEIDFLYNQINPHFLFNTIESIKGCAVNENAPTSFKMLDALGKLFRYSVTKKSFVHLFEEIKIAQSYLYIQKLRFGERLSYQCEIPDNLCSAIMPKMILQPLIENAITYGVEPLAHGEINISVKATLDILIIEIVNDGPILDPDAITHTLSLINNDTDEGGASHIGLHNVHTRLRYLYGAEYGIEFHPRTEGGARVILRIPFTMEQTDDKEM